MTKNHFSILPLYDATSQEKQQEIPNAPLKIQLLITLQSTCIFLSNLCNMIHDIGMQNQPLPENVDKIYILHEVSLR